MHPCPWLTSAQVTFAWTRTRARDCRQVSCPKTWLRIVARAPRRACFAKQPPTHSRPAPLRGWPGALFGGQARLGRFVASEGETTSVGTGDAEPVRSGDNGFSRLGTPRGCCVQDDTRQQAAQSETAGPWALRVSLVPAPPPSPLGLRGGLGFPFVPDACSPKAPSSPSLQAEIWYSRLFCLPPGPRPHRRGWCTHNPLTGHAGGRTVDQPTGTDLNNTRRTFGSPRPNGGREGSALSPSAERLLRLKTLRAGG